MILLQNNEILIINIWQQIFRLLRIKKIFEKNI